MSVYYARAHITSGSISTKASLLQSVDVTDLHGSLLVLAELADAYTDANLHGDFNVFRLEVKMLVILKFPLNSLADIHLAVSNSNGNRKSPSKRNYHRSCLSSDIHEYLTEGDTSPRYSAGSALEANS